MNFNKYKLIDRYDPSPEEIPDDIDERIREYNVLRIQDIEYPIIGDEQGDLLGMSDDSDVNID